jgi:hypothetical protein
VPLVDTIESVINRLLDAYETKDGTPVPATDDGEVGNLRQFNPNTPPDCGSQSSRQWAIGGRTIASARESESRSAMPSAWRRTWRSCFCRCAEHIQLRNIVRR